MSNSIVTTRRSVLGAGLALAGLPLGGARAAGPDIKTGADIAKAEQEGEVAVLHA